MRKFNKLAVLILLLNITSFQPLFAQCNWWVKSFGGSFADNVTDMKTDKNGNIYICGYFSGTVNLDNVTLTSAGDKDVFVAKLNSSGGVIWAKQGGGVYADQATALDIDAIGNVYVCGKYSTSATFNGNTITNASSFLLSYSSNGTFSWVKNVSSARSIDDLVVSGDYFTIVGERDGSSTFESINLANSLYFSGYLARYSLTGSISKVTNCPMFRESNILTTDLLGNVSFLTKFYGSISIDGKTISSVGGDDLIVLNYSPALALNWYKTGGGSGSEYAKNITTDANGNVYVLGTIESSGTFSGTTVNAPSNRGYVLIKYLKNGDFSWVKSTGSNSGIDDYDKYPTIIFDNNNSLYITGKTYGGDFKFDNTTVSSDNNYGGFILKCSTFGDFQDFKSTNATLNNISITNTGILGVGNFAGDDNSFSSKKLISKGLEDFFVCKLSSLSDLDATSSPELCMVTLDPTTNKNKLVWKKPDSKNIDKYIIYRMNVFGEFDSIGYQNYVGNNYFIDQAISPEKKWETYAIGLIDVCGNKSEISDGIKTMHLMIYPGPNKKWQLLWSPYTGADDPYYRIYRGTTPTNKVLIDSLTGDEDQMFMYTDIDSPSGTVYYSVEAVTGENCEQTQGPIVAGRIRSNNAYFIAETMGLDNLQSLQTMIYPNPSQGLISIRFEGKEGLYENSSLSIINHLGQSILSQNLNDVNTDLNLSELSKGIYFVKIENGDSYSIQKIVLE